MRTYDDALDVVGVHFVGGTWGALATGLFASKAINSAVTTQGLLVSGEMGLLVTQIEAIVVTYILAIVGCLICLAVTSAICGGVRVEQDDEFAGLDLSQHSESAYVFGSAGGGYEAANHGGAGMSAAS
jgi:Amt family ammonium transporter